MKLRSSRDSPAGRRDGLGLLGRGGRVWRGRDPGSLGGLTVRTDGRALCLGFGGCRGNLARAALGGPRDERDSGEDDGAEVGGDHAVS